MAYEDDSMYETDEHPMSEALYNTLACVRGFTEKNGSTYAAYCAGWTVRCELAMQSANNGKADSGDELRPNSTEKTK